MAVPQREELSYDHSTDRTPVTPLRQRMFDDMGVRSMRQRTQHDYVRHARAFAGFSDARPIQRSPRMCGASIFTSAGTAPARLHQQVDLIAALLISGTVKRTTPAHAKLAAREPLSPMQSGAANAAG